MNRILWNELIDPKGDPIANVDVLIQLSEDGWLEDYTEVVACVFHVTTNDNGRWEVSLVPNDTIIRAGKNNPGGTYYTIVEHQSKHEVVIPSGVDMISLYEVLYRMPEEE